MYNRAKFYNTLAALLGMPALLAGLSCVTLSGCGDTTEKISSVQELEEALDPSKKKVKADDKDAGKKTPAVAKKVESGGPVEPYDPAKATSTIKGVISYSGAVPKVNVIPMSDAGCAKCRKDNNLKDLTKEELTVNDGKIANAIVYVSSGSSKYNFDALTLPAARINQKGCQYFPHVLALKTEQVLEIESSDTVPHNIHMTPAENSELNISQPNIGIHDTKKRFASAEMGIPVKCDVHGWMKSAICVFDHPFFFVTKEDGSYEIKLPPGEYEISVWQENQAKLKIPKPEKVKVEAGKTEVKDFVFSPKG